MEAGMNDFLTKPFKRDDLVPVLRQWIAHVDSASVSHLPGANDAVVTDIETGDAEIEDANPFLVPQEFMSGELFGPQAAIFDPEAAVERFMGQRAIVERVVGEFVVKCAQTLGILEQYLGDGAYEDLQRDAHGLKGGAWNLDAYRLGDAAAQLEGSAKMKDPERCRYYLDALKPVVDEFSEFVKDFAAAGIE